MQRGVNQSGQVEVDAAEREAGGRDGAGAGRLASFQQAPVAQQLQDLSTEATGLWGVPASLLPLEHQRPNPGQAQFTGQHQAGRASTHNDHINIHALPLIRTARAVPKGKRIDRGAVKHGTCRAGMVMA